MVQHNYKSRTLAALDTDTLSRNVTDISLQQIHKRVRSIGDRINSPPGPRRIPNVKKALAEFEGAGILIRNATHYCLTPHLRGVLDEARIRYKVPINAAPHRQMRLYRKVLTELSERENIDLEGLAPEKIATLTRSKMQTLLKQAVQQLEAARRPPSPSASVLNRSLPFVSETDVGTAFGTPGRFTSDHDNDYFGGPMDIDMSAESQPVSLRVATQASYRLQLPPSPRTQFDTSDPNVVTTVTGGYNSGLTPTKPSGQLSGILTPPNTVHVHRTAYNLTELKTKETNLARAQEDLAKEHEDACIKLREQDEMNMRALEVKDAEVKTNKKCIVDLEKRLASLQEEFDELMSEKLLLDNRNACSRARILELESQISVLQTRYNETLTSLNTLNNRILALQEDLDAQRAVATELRATVDDLTRQCEALEDKNKVQSEVISKRKKHSLDLVNVLVQSLTDIDLPVELTQ